MTVIRDSGLKEYSYLSRYASIPTFYNSIDRKRYYGTVKQLELNSTTYIEHEVKEHETLDMIALQYFNTPLYWWIIADYNRIQDPLKIRQKVLKIPNLRDIRFE